MIYPIDEEILDELVWHVERSVPKSEFTTVLCAMRDDSDEDITRNYFQKVINEFAKNEKYCPKCGCKLTPIKNKEYHTYLQDNPYETVIAGYRCELCDCKVDLD